MKTILLLGSLVASATLPSNWVAEVPSADVRIQELRGDNSRLCTVKVYNANDDNARNVRLQVLVPFQAKAIDASTGCSITPDGRVVNCSWETINVGGTKTVTVTTNRATPAAYRANLSFSAYVSNSLPDPNPSNNFKTVRVPF